MAEAKKTIELFGHKLDVNVTNKGAAYASLRKADFDAVLEEKGVTSKVRECVTKAQDEIISEVSKAETKFLLDANKGKKEDDPDFIKSFDARLGANNFSMSVKKVVHSVSSGKAPITGKPYETHHYGRTIVTLNYEAAAEMRKEGGQFDLEAKQFEKALGLKK